MKHSRKQQNDTKERGLRENKTNNWWHNETPTKTTKTLDNEQMIEWEEMINENE